jgi:hypothetical protein
VAITFSDILKERSKSTKKKKKKEGTITSPNGGYEVVQTVEQST